MREGRMSTVGHFKFSSRIRVYFKLLRERGGRIRLGTNTIKRRSGFYKNKYQENSPGSLSITISQI